MTGHFSKLTPDLPLVWDPTMFSDLMFCAYKFKKLRVEGWMGTASKVDLEFGGFIASSLEVYKKERLNGLFKKLATIAAVRHALVSTWNDGTPWGGVFQRQWHCLGTEAYRNARGNRAKCPYSHKGVWFPEPAPEICGECGSVIEEQTNFLADHYAKNRVNLVRAVVWWCDEQPQDIFDGLHPFQFPDGTPAVELFVSAPLPFETKDGERYTLAGNLDEIAEIDDERFVLDNKTTNKPLDDAYFTSFAPGVQFDTYDLLLHAVYPELGIKGILVDAIQVLKDAVRTAKHPYYKSDSQREEHLKLLGWWLEQAEEHAVTGYWPMNKRNCGFCELRGFCALPPEDREAAMAKAGMTRQTPWDPMNRGECK